ncbi:MAG: amidohydrolase family protein [Pirellula sp.]
MESPAIREGFLVVNAGKIEHVGTRLPERFLNIPRVQLRGGAILPGLINAHCHLELSDIDQPLPVPQTDQGFGSMVGWLDQLMARRMAMIKSNGDIASIKQKAIGLGVRQAWESGTRFVVDNVTAPWSVQWSEQAARDCYKGSDSEACRALVPEVPIYIKPCIELVDVNQARYEQAWGFAKKIREDWIDMDDSACRALLGLAPHAPYTASKRLVQQAAESQSQHRGLLSMHLAESLEEIEYADANSGPFKQWITPWVDEPHIANRGTIDEYLKLLLESYRVLIAHGNYLSVSQIDQMVPYRDRVAVVYCPRTHSHFRHQEHPAKILADWGIGLFLGTDSKYSNPDLSLFEEWKTACKKFPDLGARYWMAQCTICPAKFLGVDQQLGNIREGIESLLTWVPTGDRTIATEEELWQAMLASPEAMPLEVRVSALEKRLD